MVTEITGLWVRLLVSVLKKPVQMPLFTPPLLQTANRECFALAVRKEFWERLLVCYTSAWCLSEGLVGVLRTLEPEFVHPG